MAKIYPFRGLKYNLNTVGDLSKVVTQPYDQINDDLREKYYSRSNYNFTKVISGRKEPETDMNNVYTRAADYLNEWLRDGVLVKDEKPAIYVYYQDYKVLDEIRTRKGFISLVNLQKYKKHERTHAEPKVDRFNLMKETQANTEMIFMLYSEPERIINKLFDSAIEGKEPNMIATDDFGCIHRMWALTDKKTIREVQKRMKDLDLFIADGHHRYETALNYKKYMKKLGRKCVKGSTECYNNFMMTMFNIHEPGITILPTHRLIFGLKESKIKNLLKNAMQYFTIEHFPLGDNDEATVKRVLDTMKARHRDEHLFALYIKGDSEIKLLSLKDESGMDGFIKKRSSEWKKLDVAILHTILMDKFLGINKKKLEEKTNVDYLRDPFEAFKKTKDDPKFQMVFLLNPTSIDEVLKISSNNERMPQKSTDFFPKLLSGMVMCKLMIE